MQKYRPGNGNLEWDGSIKGELEDGTEIVEYCEKCGRAGANVHELRGIGNNREPVCRYCGTKTMRHTSVASLSKNDKDKGSDLL